MTAVDETITANTATTLADMPNQTLPALADEPDWLVAARLDAAANLKSSGLPTRRDEEWRQLNLRSLFETPFVLGRHAARDALTESWEIDGLNAATIRCSNGVINRGDIAAAATATGCEISVDSDKTHFNALAAAGPFTDLNTKVHDAALTIKVAAGVKATVPIRIIQEISGDHAICSAPRVCIVAEEGSSVTVIEDHVTADTEHKHCETSVTELSAAAHTDVQHVRLCRHADQVSQFTDLSMAIEDRAEVTTHTIVLSGAIVRNEINPAINGHDVECTMNGLTLGQHKQQLDTHVRICHSCDGSRSRQYFRNILMDKAAAEFTGRIIVERPAQQTDAVQSNQNLVLSDDARAYSKPQLEIYADDVKCTHGATTGQLEPSAMSYLMARGIPRDVARSMLVYAFACESIASLPDDALRAWVTARLLDNLPASDLLRDVL